jgi:L-methionine (R)-S-oxide reductase
MNEFGWGGANILHCPACVLRPDCVEVQRMPTTNSTTNELVAQLTAIAETGSSAQEIMTNIAETLHRKMLKYNWVGFYMLEKEGKQDVLILGPFSGTMTPHTRIPLNHGICGAAASTGKTIIVDDVSADPRYLACSRETKSEIVVPVFVRKRVVGELDIDSHFLAAFSAEDRELCEHAAGVVGRWLEKHTQ